MKLQTRAKINLFLEVLGKRPDGYHELDTAFQSISLSDQMFLEKKGESIILSSTDPTLPRGGDNLVWRSYELLRKRYPGRVSGVQIHLEKRIPVGAGLGGGSADAAASLAGLNRLFELGLGDEELASISLEIGMDVPFCLKGGAALGSARGGQIRSIARQARFQVVVVYPGFAVSTREAYQGLDLRKGRHVRNSGDTVAALGQKKVDGLWPTLYNCFEEGLFEKYPLLKKIKEELRKGGCAAALVTGSGSCVCGYAPVEADLRELVSHLEKRHPFVAITRPTDEGVVFLDNAE